LISQNKNYRAMRDLLKSVHPPILPYIGIYLTDLTFIVNFALNKRRTQTKQKLMRR
jgi:hypothetical protein